MYLNHCCPAVTFLSLNLVFYCFLVREKMGGGGPTPFLYMATRFLPNVHVQNVQKCTQYVFSCLEVPWIDLLAVVNLQ